MLLYATGLFAVAALGGAVLGFLRFQERELPWPISIVHGLVAATGLILLILGVGQGAGGPLALVALGILVVAALGGFLLVSFHIRRQPAPIALVAVHALVAVIGFVCLLLAALGGRGV
jgi:hypothetical protein